MVAALLRVIHSGVQDSRLLPIKGQPEIRFFQTVLVRAGRFTTQWVRLDFDTRPQLGQQATLTLPNKGHLISRLTLITTLPSLHAYDVAAEAAAPAPFLGPRFSWTNGVGHALLTEASIDIAGSAVETLDGRLMEVLDEFYTPLEKTTLMNKLIKRSDNGYGIDTLGTQPVVVATPLPFWFAGDPGAYLPIDAIQADPVVLRLRYAPLAALSISSGRVAYPTGAAAASAAAGAAYYPAAGAQFYYADLAGQPVYGLSGEDLTVPTLASTVPGIRIPTTLDLTEAYVLAEYVYLDRPEANRFRVADIQIPIVQHYAFDPFDTRQLPRAQIPLRVPNPTRNLFFYLQRYDAQAFNMPFLATRDLSGVGTSVPWWPDASGLNAYLITDLVPGFATRHSEPITSIGLVYEGKFVRFRTDAPSIFRSLIPSMEMRKSPWVNRYMYCLTFGYDQGQLAGSFPSGEANLDKMRDVYLQLTLHPRTGSADANDVDGFRVYVWAETYNILRVYGGRAGLLFGY